LGIEATVFHQPVRLGRPVSVTVLIADAERLLLLSTRDDLRSAQTVTDNDVLTSLDVIAGQPVRVVAIDARFADSSRGVAILTRIAADPRLAACEVRIVAPDRSDQVIRAGTTGDALTTAARGIRSVARTVTPGVVVAVDGNAATLIDLSEKGAQVLTALTLRPGLRVRLSLPYTPRPIRLGAVVKWATFEMPEGGPRFRAGLEFADVEHDAIRRFLEANGEAMSDEAAS
jgi:hypothetical protein